MTVTEFKRIVSGLSTFATIREKATGPESLIGVQAKDGILKLVAGTARGGIVVIAGTGDVGEGSFTVRARPFLNTAKVLKGKLDLGLRASERGLEIVTDKGGSALVEVEGPLGEAGFAKKPKRTVATANVYGEKFAQISKLFDAVQQDLEAQVPTLHYFDGKAVFTAVSPSSKEIYASLETTGSAAEETYGAAYLDFWLALRALESDGVIEFCEDGVVARSGIYEVFSGPYRVSPYNPRTRTSSPPSNPKPWATLGWHDDAATARVSIDRKVLIDAIKGQAPDDEYQRITLEVDTGTLKVNTFGSESGLTLPANSSGNGVRSVQSKKLLGVLRAIDSKEIELAWGKSPAVRVNSKEYSNWLVLIAPVTMTNG